mmetsp:Transcript_6723/g.16685  ORF Transcript_6723/g.16685 Transcript_6723/m.16685 type:complete len:412 (-) Transcript_6723:291-1526(-)
MVAKSPRARGPSVSGEDAAAQCSAHCRAKGSRAPLATRSCAAAATRPSSPARARLCSSSASGWAAPSFHKDCAPALQHARNADATAAFLSRPRACWSTSRRSRSAGKALVQGAASIRAQADTTKGPRFGASTTCRKMTMHTSTARPILSGDAFAYFERSHSAASARFHPPTPFNELSSSHMAGLTSVKRAGVASCHCHAKLHSASRRAPISPSSSSGHEAATKKAGAKRSKATKRCSMLRCPSMPDHNSAAARRVDTLGAWRRCKAGSRSSAPTRHKSCKMLAAESKRPSTIDLQAAATKRLLKAGTMRFASGISKTIPLRIASSTAVPMAAWSMPAGCRNAHNTSRSSSPWPSQALNRAQTSSSASDGGRTSSKSTAVGQPDATVSSSRARAQRSGTHATSPRATAAATS